MADTLLTPTVILAEALMVLTDHTPAVQNVNKSYSEEFGKQGMKIGDSVTYRIPNESTVGTTMDIDVEDTTETSGTVTIDTVRNIAWDFHSADLALTIDEYRERYIEPKVIQLAHNVEALLQQEMGRAFYNYVGAAGTTPNTSSVIGDAKQKLQESLTPKNKPWCGIINSAAENELVDVLSSLYHNAKNISQQNIEGAMKRLRGFDFYQSDLVYRHTVGAHDACVVNGASQTGATLNIDGCDTSTTDFLKDGDKFTVAGCNKVHPQTKADLGVLQQFTVTADVDSNGSGEAALSISPSIDTSGPYQNCSASPTDGGSLTILGTAETTYPFNLFFHPDSTSLVSVDLPIPDNTWGHVETYNGLRMAIVKDFDITTRREIARIDIMFGIDFPRPQLGCVMIG
jgi:hypothetical protein